MTIELEVKCDLCDRSLATGSPGQHGRDHLEALYDLTLETIEDFGWEISPNAVICAQCINRVDDLGYKKA